LGELRSFRRKRQGASNKLGMHGVRGRHGVAGRAHCRQRRPAVVEHGRLGDRGRHRLLRDRLRFALHAIFQRSGDILRLRLYVRVSPDDAKCVFNRRVDVVRVAQRGALRSALTLDRIGAWSHSSALGIAPHSDRAATRKSLRGATHASWPNFPEKMKQTHTCAHKRSSNHPRFE